MTLSLTRNGGGDVTSQDTRKRHTFPTIVPRALGAAIMALVLVGCSAPPVEGPSGAPEPQTPLPNPPVMSGWQDWRPSEPVRDLAKLSEADKLALRTSNLANLAQQFEITDPPEVELERWIRVDEIGPTAAECLGEAGFDVESTSNGQGWRLVSALGEGQGPALDLAYYTCAARYSVDPAMTQPQTRDQQRVMHEYFTDMLIPCLQQLGYQAPEVPSLETFTGMGGRWSPIQEIGLDPSEDRMDQVLDACEQAPPPTALYGE